MQAIRMGMRLALGLAACAAFSATTSAQCGTADVHESNDTCATAVLLTAGTHTGLTCQGPADPGGTNLDFFRVTVPAGDQLLVDVLHSWAVTEDLDAYIYDASSPTCGDQLSYLTRGYTSDDNESMIWANATGASVDLIIEVTPWFGGGTPVICDDYDLVLTLTPDPCQAGIDDSFEQNDFCAAAATIATGSHVGLFVSTSDEDYFKIQVPAAHQVLIDQTYVSSIVELGLELYSDPGCANVVGSSSWGGGSNQIIASNTIGAATDFYLRVSVVDLVCGNYDINIAIQPDPCQAGLDDSFEDNDSCATAVVLPAGSSTGLFATAFDDDFYKINVPAGDQLLIDQAYVSALGELGIEIYDDASCTNLVSSQSWTGGLNQVRYSNATGAATDFYIRAFMVSGDCNNYDLFVTVQPDPCLAPGLDDSFEDNDFCGSGVVLNAGTHTGLFILISDFDFYEITVAPGDQVTIDQAYNPTVELFFDLFSDPACSFWETGTGWGGGLNSATWANNTGAPATLYMSCGIVGGAAADCNNYDLTVTFMPDPCQSPLSDDGFEDNESCATAYTISSQAYTGLFVSKSDADVYTFQLNPGGTADISVDHIAVNGDIDVHLYDDSPGTCLDGASYLVAAETGNNSEQISWSNNTGSTVTYYLHIEVWTGSAFDCNDYDMSVNLVGNQIAFPTCQGDSTFNAGSGTVGCPCGNNSPVGMGEGCLNSQGRGALIDATGSNGVAQDNIAFHLSQARPNQPSMLLQGSTLIGLTFKDGILCMGNPTERIQVVITNSSGAGSTSASVVTEGGISGPGVTRYYQFWYRDPALSTCGTGSNLSSGLMVNWM